MTNRGPNQHEPASKERRLITRWETCARDSIGVIVTGNALRLALD
jgi:hypothetical protein